MLVPGIIAGAHVRSLEKPSRGPSVPFFIGTGGTGSAAVAGRTPRLPLRVAAKTIANAMETKRSARNRTQRVYPRAPTTVNAMRFRPPASAAPIATAFMLPLPTRTVLIVGTALIVGALARALVGVLVRALALLGL